MTFSFVIDMTCLLQVVIRYPGAKEDVHGYN